MPAPMIRPNGRLFAILLAGSILASIATPTAARAADVLYGCSSDGAYFKIDVTTGASTFLTYLAHPANEIAYDPISHRAFAQNLYGAHFGFEINPFTGSILADSIQNNGSYDGLEFVGGVLYGTDTLGTHGISRLRSLNPWTGASVLIGPTGVGLINGLAYDASSSTMYGITGGPGTNSLLVQLNLSTGAATTIGNTGIDAGSLEFGPDGSLYAGTLSSPYGALYRINPATAAATFVALSWGDPITGLMLAPECTSTHSQIQLAGTFTNPAYDLSQSPAMTASGCTWQVTTHLEAGTYFFKFVTDGALDSPPDYGWDGGSTFGLPGGPYPTRVVSGPGTDLGMFVLNPDDYTFTLDEQTRTWSVTAAHGPQSGYITGSLDFEFAFDYPPYPVATVEYYRGATLLTTQLTDRNPYYYPPSFSLGGLADGDYRVKISAPGYAPLEISPVTVAGGAYVNLGLLHLTSVPSSFSRLDLVGDFNGFTIGADPMAQAINGYWSASRMLGPGDYAMRVATNGALDVPPDYVALYPYLSNSIPFTADMKLGTGHANDLHLHVAHSGKYQFNMDERNLTLNVFELPPPPPAIDINRVKMLITNEGWFAYDPSNSVAGLEFPKGSGKTAVFSAGLWISAGALDAITEYSDEFRPGAMVGGKADNPANPDYKVYKLNRTYANTADRDSDLVDYQHHAMPHGAPPVTLLPNGDLSIQGDQMLWHVYNDADTSQHTNTAGSTLPLGLEIQQTAFAFNQPPPLGNTVFLSFKLLNKGSNMLSDMYVGLWADPDLGDFTDDLVGCDPSRALGFCYNGAPTDAIYGAAPPAVGFDLLQGPLAPGGASRLAMTSFIKYINGTDPTSSTQAIHYLHGLNADGTPIIDPTTLSPTKFMVSGDPVASTGWVDSGPSDRRLLLSSGPITMAPGNEQDIAVAILIGEGADRLSSVTALKYDDDQVQALFDTGFNPATAVLASLVSTQVEPGRAQLVWDVASRGATVTVYRAEPNLAWRAIGTATPDGSGRIEFTDPGVRAGARYGYRLGIPQGGVEVMAGEVWLDVPQEYEFALQGVRPNPAVGALWVSFALPSADPATLELLDLGGRRVLAQDVGVLGAGAHTLKLGSTSGLPPGLYVVRLRQGTRTKVAKAAIIR